MSDTVKPAYYEQSNRPVMIATYLNHRGELKERRFVPNHIMYGTSEHHPEPTFLLYAWDEDKQAYRTFDMTRFASPWRKA